MTLARRKRIWTGSGKHQDRVHGPDPVIGRCLKDEHGLSGLFRRWRWRRRRRRRRRWRRRWWRRWRLRSWRVALQDNNDGGSESRRSGKVLQVAPVGFDREMRDPHWSACRLDLACQGSRSVYIEKVAELLSTIALARISRSSFDGKIMSMESLRLGTEAPDHAIDGQQDRPRVLRLHIGNRTQSHRGIAAVGSHPGWPR